MKNYDSACAKYYSKLNILTLPLTTWEFRKDYLDEAVHFHKIQANWSINEDFLKQSQKDKREIIITNKHFKIIFTSRNFSKINGYLPKEIIGKSPSMFQGKATCKATRARIKTALNNLKPFKEVILNYKKNGESYWCEIEAYPMFSEQGEFLNYIALEKFAA